LNEALSKAAETAGEQGEVPAQEEITAEGKPAGENAVIQKDGVILEQSSVSNETAALTDGRGAEVTNVKAHVTTDLKALLGEDGVKELKALMDKAGIPEELTEKVSKGEYTTKDALNLLRAASENDTLSNEMKGELSALLKSGPYKALVKNEFANSFLMNPSDVADKEKVKDYYSKLSEDTQRLLQILNGSADKNAVAAGKDVQNLKSNIDFMNDMNAALTYIQLPLKMADNSAHGDLYVYTNKKNLAKKDGNVSALLHLDMEHLGTMDIHVSMNAEKNVKTHFIMQREEMLDFIAAHLHELDEALNKRGYSMKSDVSLNREETSVPELMFKKGTNARLIQKTAFDVRA
ncbi:MAG: flagellar hook-length control protein FliK, partial [Lachnospiraceae bacterium]|nr:flagellar hook-length control protein FliK [Lachnospiraceae bacterium]